MYPGPRVPLRSLTSELDVSRSRTYIILGIGNCLLTDDGVGIHAVQCLQKDPPPDTIVVDVGTDFLSAIPYFEQGQEILVIDAMDAGGSPGTIYRCRSDDLAAPIRQHSLHELGLLAIQEFLDEHQRRPLHVLGVQPESIDFGVGLSPKVAAVLPDVVAAARKIIAEFASRPVETSEYDLAGLNDEKPC